LATSDVEDVVAWLTQQMAMTSSAGLLRIGWDPVGRIVERIVAVTSTSSAPRAWS
jgi:hypothetical protein